MRGEGVLVGATEGGGVEGGGTALATAGGISSILGFFEGG